MCVEGNVRHSPPFTRSNMKLEEMEDGGIDAGLLMLEMIGGTWSDKEIAEVCGVKEGEIEYIRRKAMVKVRKKLQNILDTKVQMEL